jgi:hypothetical protein
MIGIDLAQSLAPATGAMITTHVDAVHDATLARETLRDTGATTIRITMSVAFDASPVAVATATFHVTAATRDDLLTCSTDCLMIPPGSPSLLAAGRNSADDPEPRQGSVRFETFPVPASLVVLHFDGWRGTFMRRSAVTKARKSRRGRSRW